MTEEVLMIETTESSLMQNSCSPHNKEATITNENVAERLPELDEVDAINAVSHQQLSWAHGFMDNHKDGQTYFLKDCGVHLQRVNETESRCVAIVDHSYCYASLAMMALSFEKAGIGLQVDPYTVVIPYEPRDEKEAPHETTGVEVA